MSRIYEHLDHEELQDLLERTIEENQRLTEVIQRAQRESVLVHHGDENKILLPYWFMHIKLG